MTRTPALDEILAVLSAASVGDTSARVPVPEDSALDAPATKLAIGINLLLDDLAFRSAERERAMEDMRKSGTSFRLLFANNPLPMWVYDLETLGFVEVNHAAVAHYGYTRDEFLAMRITDIRPAEDVPRLLEDLAQPRPTLQVSGEWRHRRKKGDLIDVEIASHRVTLNGRDVVLVVAHDVTDRKQVEAEREASLARERAARAEVERLNAELEHRVASRTAQLEMANNELEAFSYSVAHDLRAPLRTMDGFSRLMMDEYASHVPEEARRYLDRIRQGAQQMGLLIDDLLTFARLARQPLNRQQVDMKRLVRQIADQLLQQYGGGHVSLAVDDLPDANADAGLLRQVVDNLLSNALKFSRARAEPRIEVTYRPNGDDPIYVVRDNGVGFDMRYADKLFGVFQRLHRAEEYEGTGVASRSSSASFTGTAGRSGLKRRSTTARHFPLRWEGRAMASDPVEILLVEDNPNDVELTLHALRKNNVTNSIQVARDGAEALDFVFGRGPHSGRSLREGPKVILLDLKLPKVDGLEVLRQIKGHPDFQQIPVVILTSSKEESDVVRSYELGVNSYIVKPVDFTQFAEAVRQLGLYWIILNQPPAR